MENKTDMHCEDKETANYLPLYFPDLTPKLKERARVELFEDDDKIKDALDELKSLIKGDKGNNLKTDEELLLFLRARKYNVERAHALYGNHIALIKKHNRIFKGFKISDFQKVYDANCYGFLPRRDADGCSIMTWLLEKWDVSQFSLLNIAQAMVASCICMMQCPITQITGYKMIVDFSCLSFRKLASLHPWLLKFSIDLVQSSMPMRLKEIHIVNHGSLFYYFWALLYPLLSKKLRERVHFHGSDMESLHKYIPPAILPEELGGECGPQDNTEFIELLRNSEGYITSYIEQIRQDQATNPQ